jgi:hypothetical protein
MTHGRRDSPQGVRNSIPEERSDPFDINASLRYGVVHEGERVGKRRRDPHKIHDQMKKSGSMDLTGHNEQKILRYFR